MSEDLSVDTPSSEAPLESLAPSGSGSRPGTRKRSASASFVDVGEGTSRKRLKEDASDCQDIMLTEEQTEHIDGDALVNDLAQELQCGCCSELVYRPVVVSPCQHFFCGSCCTLWIANGGTNCPACRGISTLVTPSRALQSMLDVLLRFAPSRTRTERERAQADEVYKVGTTFRMPPPREPSPPPTIPQHLDGEDHSDFARPCPHCLAGNQYGWRCPNPIPDPSVNIEEAWHLDDGMPPGHAYCGNCESILALHAPSTTKCDFCQVSFCGINVLPRCVASSLLSAHPHGMVDRGDFIQSSEVYDSFEQNTVEVDIMFDYLTAQGITPRHIYREIIIHIQSLPRKFAPLIEQDLFEHIHGVSGGTDPDPSTPRARICRLCAAEILLWGLRDWWLRERKKGRMDANVLSRKDCPDGSHCEKQMDLAHAKEFNHMIALPEPDPPEPEAPSSSQVPTEPASSDDLPDSEFPQVVDSETVPHPETQPLSHVPTESASSPIESEVPSALPVDVESSMEVDLVLDTSQEDTDTVEAAIPILSILSQSDGPSIERQSEELPLPHASVFVADVPLKEHGTHAEDASNTSFTEQISQDEVVDMLML